MAGALASPICAWLAPSGVLLRRFMLFSKLGLSSRLRSSGPPRPGPAPPCSTWLQLAEAEKELKRQAFEKALATPDEKPYSEQVCAAACRPAALAAAPRSAVQACMSSPLGGGGLELIRTFIFLLRCTLACCRWCWRTFSWRTATAGRAWRVRGACAIAPSLPLVALPLHGCPPPRGHAQLCGPCSTSSPAALPAWPCLPRSRRERPAAGDAGVCAGHAAGVQG